jgi:hypothetical protein
MKASDVKRFATDGTLFPVHPDECENDMDNIVIFASDFDSYVKASDEAWLAAQAKLTEVIRERDGLKEIIECAKTPLMADVLRERDEYKHDLDEMIAAAVENEDIIESAKRHEAELARCEEALKEVSVECTCRCDVAYASRRLHAPDCMGWVGDIARAALSPKEVSHE